ncbi:Clp protease N-terminal domain-containing protein [Streptomyces sp. NPDC012888]|uniref:Clp protease N-terminal domain-containing protein n=1 Tax=Streptomyces sp. NPDC012888 TaxID=3364855 RepID=UPI0036D01D19
MFERFTAEARQAVVDARTEAARAGAPAITEEHLLLALLETGALDPLGVDRAGLRSALAAARRRGGLSKADEAALAELGIDVSEVVARVEDTHGEGVLAAAAPTPRRFPASLFPRRREPGAAGHRPFTGGAKRVLEQSLRIALGRRDRTIGAQHLLLALVSRPGPAADALADHGVTYATAERALAA